jgi:hypothetical protein
MNAFRAYGPETTFAAKHELHMKRIPQLSSINTIPKGRIALLSWSHCFVNINQMVVMGSCREGTNLNIAYLHIFS